MRLIQAFLVTVFLFSATITTAEAALLTVYPTGDGSFTINGSAMGGVVGIELTIGYDASYLQSPVVSQGALVDGALMAVNTSDPGVISLAIISSTPFSGSGQIVAIQFASPTRSGSITSVKAKLIDADAVSLPVSVTISDSRSCGSGGIITIADVQSAINMFLGLKAVEVCVDTGGDGNVSIAEVQKVINGFLGL